jgi:hypothetical protein
MLNDEVIAHLEALITYCEAHEDGEADWQMLHRLLAGIRGAVALGPELGLLYAHVRPYIDERLQVLLLEDMWEAFRQRHAAPAPGGAGEEAPHA